jgi:hypothetical protein
VLELTGEVSTLVQACRRPAIRSNANPKVLARFFMAA